MFICAQVQAKPLSPQGYCWSLSELYHAGPARAIFPPYAEKAVAGVTTNVATLASAASPTMAVAAGVVATTLAFGIGPDFGLN